MSTNDPQDVAIGDTFERVGKGPAVWEVTSDPHPNGTVRLDGAAGTIITDIDELAKPARWRRARCL